MTKNIATMGDNNPPSETEILYQRLETKHAPVLNGAHKLIEAATRIPEKIADEGDAAKATDYIKMVVNCRKNLESERVGEKEPFLTLGRAVDGFFKRFTDSLDGAKVKAQRSLDTWLKLKAAEEMRRRAEESAELRRKAEEEAQAAKMLEDAKMQPMAEKMLDQAALTEKESQVVAQSVQARPAEMAQSRGTSGATASLRTRWVGEIVMASELDLNTLRPFLNPEALQKALNLYVQAGGRELKGAKIYEKSEAVVR